MKEVYIKNGELFNASKHGFKDDATRYIRADITPEDAWQALDWLCETDFCSEIPDKHIETIQRALQAFISED